mmetsp:Transcript_1248/g.2867  ORF Transcript_1248/g.2867 Transcript_1248/m.2867 type:complete len:86 (-) Transcript_1248:205-462(-)
MLISLHLHRRGLDCFCFQFDSKGADPEEVAATVLNSVSDGKTDFVVAATFSAKAALWLKFFVPSFLENMLVKRFEKGKIETKKEV